MHELADGAPTPGRVRRPGASRKLLTQTDPQVHAALLALVEPDTRGNQDSPLRWTTKSIRHLAPELTHQGHCIRADTVGDLLRARYFSLQGNARTREGQQPSDRDAQFADTGREWRPMSEPLPVNTHDFLDDAVRAAIPYGVYDLAENAGVPRAGLAELLRLKLGS